MKNWDILSNIKITTKNFTPEKVQKVILENRGIKTKKEIKSFLYPDLKSLTVKSLEIDEKNLEKVVLRVKKAIKQKEKIIVYGDYDVDGVCGSAILWESLNSLGADVMPYIPHRTDEGYGLSKKGIDNLLKTYPDTKIIITVDNGIVANEAVEYGNSLGLQIIITDHHTIGEKKPEAFAIVHSTKICGAAVGWFFARSIAGKIINKDDEHLGLVALATVADVMKLKEYNRTLLVYGLPHLRNTTRPGLLSLFELAGIDKTKIGVYEIGHMIGPRINATGRLEHAMDSLRLLCTKDYKRGRELAEKLNSINTSRQKITIDSVIHAKELVKGKIKKLIFVYHESYEPGVIGLIAGRLTEEYYRPSIVLSKGERYSKASARSVVGFNIIDFIRLSSHLLVDAGGHPGAAGFTVETSKIEELHKFLEKAADKKIAEELLVRKLPIDCELDLDLVNEKLFDGLQVLSPFGYGNPDPVFLSKKVTIENINSVGADKKHLKIQFGKNNFRIGGILFNYDTSLKLAVGDRVDIVYSLSENQWNGNRKLEIKLKDIAKL